MTKLSLVSDIISAIEVVALFTMTVMDAPALPVELHDVQARKPQLIVHLQQYLKQGSAWH